MIPRFRTDIEKLYIQTFPNEDEITEYYQICETKAYHELLMKAIERDSSVKEEEIIAIAGKEAYKEYKAYLDAWD